MIISLVLSCIVCSIFQSFEAGIANPISSSKWRKMFILKLNTVALLIFARFQLSRISREGQIHKFENLAIFIIIIALPIIETDN